MNVCEGNRLLISDAATAVYVLFFEGTRCICPRTLFLQKNKIFTISPVRDGAWKIFYILLLISMLQIIGIRCGFHARKMEIPCR